MEKITLSSPLKTALGIRAAAKLVEKLELTTVGDLLRYYPRKYDQRGKLTDLAALVVGERATVWAKVVKVTGARAGLRPSRKPAARAAASGTSPMSSSATATGSSPARSSTSTTGPRCCGPGTDAMFSGKVSMFNNDAADELAVGGDRRRRAAAAPDGDAIDVIESFPGGVIPVYPLVEGVTQTQVQHCVRAALDLLAEIADPVPDVLLARHGLVDLDTALRDIHRPRNQQPPGGRRSNGCATTRRWPCSWCWPAAGRTPGTSRPSRVRGSPAGCWTRSTRNLPFELTDGQRAVGETIATDLATIHPMNRLLQGEVGSGKTVVALRAMLQVIDSGRQAVMLAPTEVLAAQHARSLRDVLGPLGRGGELGATAEATAITLLTGSLPAKARKQALLTIASGQAGHRRRHPRAAVRGGVLRQPRADRGRRAAPVRRRAATCAAHQASRRQSAARAGDDGDPDPAHRGDDGVRRPGHLDAVRAAQAAGRRSAPRWCRPRRSPAGSSGPGSGSGRRSARAIRPTSSAPRSVTTSRPSCSRTAAIFESDSPRRRMQAGPPTPAGGDPGGRRCCATGRWSDLRLGVLHGRLPPGEKDDVMTAFAAGELDVLVATTVIEVGVDVPNATMMVIMDAERFGMSQLHQLRGRVGRGQRAGDLPAGQRGAGGHRRAGSGWTRSPPPTTGSRWPRPTWNCAGRATCSAPRRPAGRPRSGSCRCCGTGTVIEQAREDAIGSGRRRPGDGGVAGAGGDGVAGDRCGGARSTWTRADTQAVKGCPEGGRAGSGPTG